MTVPFLAAMALSPEVANLVVLQYDVIFLLLGLAISTIKEDSSNTFQICLDMFVLFTSFVYGSQCEAF